MNIPTSQGETDEIISCQTAEGIYLSMFYGEADEQLGVILDYLQSRDKLKIYGDIDELKKDFFDFNNRDPEIVLRLKKVLKIIRDEFFSGDKPKIEAITEEKLDKLEKYLTNYNNIPSLVDEIKNQSSEIVSELIKNDEENINSFGHSFSKIGNIKEKEIFFIELMKKDDVDLKDKLDLLFKNNDFLSCLKDYGSDKLKERYLIKHFKTKKKGDFTSNINRIFLSIDDSNIIKDIILKCHNNINLNYISSFLGNKNISEEIIIKILQEPDIIRRFSVGRLHYIVGGIGTKNKRIEIIKLFSESRKEKSLITRLKEKLF